MLRNLIVAALVLLASAGASVADTRVEVLGRVTFNGFAFGYCGGDQPCPYVNVRVGEFAYMTYVVDDAMQDISTSWPPCPGHPTYTPTSTAWNIRDGSYFIRIADVPLAAPVSTLASGATSPNMTINWENCTVDRMDLNGGAFGRGGRCCFASGSCTYTKQADCEGAWTFGAPCTAASNACAQPVGVCCATDNTCTTLNQAACTTSGGVWAYGGACSSSPCPQDVGSCCGADGSCAITAQTNCTSTWTYAGACDVATCPRPPFHPDYGLSQMIAGGATGFFTSADISQNHRTYPTSVFDPNYQLWQLTYGYIDATGPHQFDLDVPLQIMVISDAATPTGSCCPGDGHCLVTTQAICPVSASWSSGAACSANTCPSGSGACCLANGSCQLMTQAACAGNANAVYMLNGTSCGVGICPLTGACCNGGSCSIIIQSACSGTGGSWLGVASTCLVQAQNVATLASNVAGACCHGDGTCNLAFQSACSGGIWTLGATCDTPCPNAGACCDTASGACVIESQAACIGANWSPTDTCATLCLATGRCCNPNSGSCSVVLQSACVSGSTFVPDGTCNTPCPGAGACCNTINGYCYMLTQALCQSGSTWSAATTCSTPCSTPGVTLPDATFHSAPGDAPKGDTPGAFTNTISVTSNATIQSMTVSLNIAMSRVNDLHVLLIGPNGASVDLFSRIGSKPPQCTVTPVGAGYIMSGTYYFTDSAPQSFYDYVSSLPAGSNTTPGSYKPAGCGGTAQSLLGTFGGTSSAGQWTLAVQDERSGTRAILYSWGISFNGGNPAPCTIGKCTTGAACIASTFAQCATPSVWSLGTCTIGTCSSGTPGACCFLDTCTVTCSSLCPAGAVFRGNGISCTANICNVACCTSTGTCSFTTPTDCAGTYGSPGSSCTPNTCTQPGACCLSTGACVSLLGSSCTAVGGTAGAPSSVCNSSACPHGTPPGNDVCSVVAALAQGSAYDVALDSSGLWADPNGALDNATPDGVIASCSAGVATADVWWRFRPTVSGAYLISTCSSLAAWDSVVSVWTDCATQIPGAGGCVDDGGANGFTAAGTGSCPAAPGSNTGIFGHGSLTATLNANTNYFIRVGAFSPKTTPATGTGYQYPIKLTVDAWGACCSTTGSCFLRIFSSCTGSNIFQGPSTACVPQICPAQTTGPDNDACAVVLAGNGGPGSEILLSGGAWSSSSATLANATADGNVPSCAYLTSPDVWFRFTPAITGPYLLRTCNSPTSWDTTVSVWSSCTTQVPGACGDDSCGSAYGHGSTTTTLSAGTTYLVRVGTYSTGTTNSGPFQLDVNILGACCTVSTCTLGLASACNGSYRGDGTTCSPNPCAPQTGVCCRGSTCAITTALGCSTSLIPGQLAGATFSNSQHVCNSGVISSSPCCFANYNKINGITVQDIFDFLNDWFAGSPYANTGQTVGTPLAVQNIFDFLSNWFAGGC